VFEGGAWADYQNMQRKDRNALASLHRIIKEILRHPDAGRGRPERLKHHDIELWSRRINQKDRVVYRYDDEYVYIYAIHGHYDRL